MVAVQRRLGPFVAMAAVGHALHSPCQRGHCFAFGYCLWDHVLHRQVPDQPMVEIFE
ncbi:hypothetical protein SDC9_150461 [bioreactor metagenome]|uniref:Uncharacterized protein n=1 Tax=bioreactor metagenome TaxID=1076179 RepID=A0A645EMJ4_9ZZZZ